MLYLRGQDELLTDMEARLRDTSNARWTDDEIVTSLNRALQQWEGRVATAAVWDAGAFPRDTYETELPDWLGDDVRPQLQWASVPGSLLPNTWRDVASYEVEPRANGGRTLRLHVVPSTGTWTAALRLLYYVTNGAMPAASMSSCTLSASIAADAAAATVGAVLDVAPAGWVRIDKEWMHYRGVERQAAATVLLNLLRGQADTAAASHNLSTRVYWGVGAPHWTLFDQLRDQAAAFCHELYLNSAAAKERDLHERMVSYYQGRADLFWRRMAPTRSPRLKLPPMAC